MRCFRRSKSFVDLSVQKFSVVEDEFKDSPKKVVGVQAGAIQGEVFSLRNGGLSLCFLESLSQVLAIRTVVELGLKSGARGRRRLERSSGLGRRQNGGK